MTAKDYPITTPYGQVAGYPLNGGFHRGEDRAMPVGTQVIVNGVLIGLSGNTGASTGPHLHVGRWVGGAVTAPNGGGFNFNSAVVTEVGYDAASGNFIRIQADGASWVYLHLSKQLVSKGQELKGEPMVNRGDIINMWKSTGLKTDPPESYLKHWDGKDWKSFMYDLTQQNEWKQGLAKPAVTPLKPGIYEVK